MQMPTISTTKPNWPHVAGFLGLTFGLTWTAYLALWGSFSVLPVLATFVARTLTGDTSPWYLKPNFRKSWKTYLFAAFAPGIAIFLSGLLYFCAFRRIWI